ncbi:PAS domain S-box protein [Hugenholtzia roseola]|uniref:PAS domain S-box protein n=1 Tax=Hugenholtzia roseola TaxID=1002 RepID=UPI000426E3B9|nr:PAS domain S-box protein [Hugenholtzia roseola]
MKKYIRVEDFKPSLEKMQAFKDEVYERVDRLMESILGSYVAFSIILSFFYREEWEWYLLLISGGLWIGYYLGKKFVNAADLRYLLSSILAMFSILFMVQMQGAFYVHFSLFITMSLLVLYQNWRLIAVFATITGLYSVICFLLIVELDYQGLRYYFLDVADWGDKDRAWLLGFLGTLMGALQFACCVVFARYLEAQTEKNAQNRIYLYEQLNIEDNIKIAEQIAKGDLYQQFQPKENDAIGAALLDMRDNLRQFVEKERAVKWHSDGIALISSVSVSSDTVAELVEKVLKETIKYLHAQQGSIFLLETDENTQVRYLKTAATFAFGTERILDSEVGLGEGLIGQVGKTCKTAYLEQVPDNYFYIKSGLGQAPPKSLIVIPLHLKGSLVGVLEIASMHYLKDFEKHFLEEISERIAATLLALRAKTANEILLRETQEFTEQLRAQEEEMRQNVEELSTTQEELARQMQQTELIKNELAAQVEALNQSALVFETDATGRIVFANPKFAETLKIKPDEALGKNLRELFGQATALLENWEVARLGQVAQCTFQASKSDGIDFWANATFAPVLDEDENTRKVIVIAFDVSRQVKQDKRLKRLLQETEKARNRASQANKNASEQLRAINASIAMAEFDKDGYFVSVNPVFCSILGYNAKELVGADHHIITPPHIMESPLYKEGWRRLSEGDSVEGEFQRVAKDGTKKYLKGSYTSVLDEEGKVIKVILLCYDVTPMIEQAKDMEEFVSQMQAQEEEMRVSMEMLQQMQEDSEVKAQELEKSTDKMLSLMHLLDTSPAIIARCYNDESYTMFHVNQRAEEILGYSKAEIEARGFADFMHPEDIPLVNEAVADKLAIGEPYYISYRLLPKNGQPKWVWEHGRSITYEGKSFIDFFIFDISYLERDEVEEIRLKKDTKTES